MQRVFAWEVWMITHHIDPEAHIIEMTIGEKVGREELNNLFKEIEGPLHEWDKIRVLKRVDALPEMETMAWVDDFKFAFKNFASFKKVDKVAVVTDKAWIAKYSELMGPVIPAEVKVFENEDIDEARSWLL
jgi:hypothetical protein